MRQAIAYDRPLDDDTIAKNEDLYRGFTTIGRVIYHSQLQSIVICTSITLLIKLLCMYWDKTILLQAVEKVFTIITEMLFFWYKPYKTSALE